MIISSLLVQFVELGLLATSLSLLQIIVGGVLAALGNFAVLSPGCAHIPELLPPRARGSAMVFADGIGHLGGAVQPFIVIAALELFGACQTFWIIASFLILCNVTISAGIKNISGRTGENCEVTLLDWRTGPI